MLRTVRWLRKNQRRCSRKESQVRKDIHRAGLRRLSHFSTIKHCQISARSRSDEPCLCYGFTGELSSVRGSRHEQRSCQSHFFSSIKGYLIVFNELHDKKYPRCHNFWRTYRSGSRNWWASLLRQSIVFLLIAFFKFHIRTGFTQLGMWCLHLWVEIHPHLRHWWISWPRKDIKYVVLFFDNNDFRGELHLTATDNCTFNCHQKELGRYVSRSASNCKYLANDSRHASNVETKATETFLK